MENDSPSPSESERIAALEAQVAQLLAENERLREQLGQNSKNSHLPPSTDGPGSSSGRQSRKKSGRKRGGQPGHKGNHRSLLPQERVDVVVDLFPESCSACANPLPKVVDAAARRYQEVEFVDYRTEVREWRRHSVACPGCGAETLAAYDADVLPRYAFGPRLSTMLVFLTGGYHLSRRQAQRLASEFFGVQLSVGALSAMEGRMSEALSPAHAEALGEVQSAGVKHSDETTWAQCGVRRSLWVLASAAATVYQIFPNGKGTTIRKLFGALLGTLVSDRATVFGFWTMERRQICHAHLLRKYVSFSERDGPVGRLGKRLLDLTVLMFSYWHGFLDGHLSREEFRDWMRPLRRDMEDTLAQGACMKIKRFSGSCADILAHKDALWTFVKTEGIVPTNNHAERALRPMVLWRKRSYGSQSERGDHFAARIMTCIATLRKQGVQVYDFLVDSIRAWQEGGCAPRLLGA